MTSFTLTVRSDAGAGSENPLHSAKTCSRSVLFNRVPTHGLANQLYSVTPNGFNRASFHRFFAERLVLGILRLLKDVRMTSIIIPREIRGRSFTAEITIDTLIIYVKFPCHILWIFIRNVSHKTKALSFRLN